MRFDRAGSHIAEMLSSLGLLGVLAWVALAGLFFAISAVSILYLVTRKERVNPAYEEVNSAFLVLVFGFFISQFFYYQNTLLAFSFWFFLALGVIAFEQGMKELNISLRKYLEIALAARTLFLLLLLGAAFACLFGARIYLADTKYLKALRLASSPASLSSQIDFMAEAAEMNPWQGEYKMSLSRLFFGRAKEELLLDVKEQDKAMISLDVQKALAYARGDVVEGRRIQGATQVAPKRVAAWETLGSLYQEINFAPGAAEWGIKAYEEAIKLEPTNPVLYNELAKVYGAKEDIEKAREYVEKAIFLKPDNFEAQRQSALLYEKQGDAQSAKQLLEALVVKYPADPELLFQLGRLYYNMKEVARAILQFEETLRLAPNHSNAHYALGVAYEDARKVKEAILEFERVLELNPENEEVVKRLEQLR
jgi:Flp pilus assembly protein TadD